MKQTWVAHIRWMLGREEIWTIYIEFGEGTIDEAWAVLWRHFEENPQVLPTDVRLMPVSKEIA